MFADAGPTATARGSWRTTGWSASRSSIVDESTFSPIRDGGRRLATERCQTIPGLQLDALAVVVLSQERQDLIPSHVLQTGPTEIAHQE
jgi:hypothetical protein